MLERSGPVLLILGGILLSLGIAGSLSGTAAIVASWVSILLVSLALLSLFASVLFKGLGSDRSMGTILAIAITGIGTLIAQFGFLYRWTGFRGPAGNPSESYFEAFYFSVVTWTTLGYGDFVPADGARHIVIVEAMLGYLMMALLIAVFVASISKSRPSSGSR